MRQICHEHCPGGSAGAASAAVIAVGALIFAVAEFVAAYALVLAAGAVAVVVAVFGLERVLLRRTVLVAPWRKQVRVVVSLPAPKLAAAIVAPRRVVEGFVIDEEEVHVDRA
jgi:hypothetical protein